MGIFDFISGSGSKEVVPPKPSPAATKASIDAAMTQTLTQVLDKYDLKVEHPKVSFDGGVVKISGKAENQTTREKVVLALGNIKGVSQVDDQMTVDKVEPQAKFYTVKSGDTLGKIAKEYYGNAGKYPVIFEANKPMLKSADLIYPGQVLRIPPQD
ncbi:MAG: peptidoglycan-binding protein LysM [Bacteroidia bacterium]|nr:peptidoglycan-binding protein LysM [Bacteroidia bacterium]